MSSEDLGPETDTSSSSLPSDLVSRKEAARILGLTVEGVRKYEGRKLTPEKRGVSIHYDRGEVEALRAARGSVVPAATKAERESEKLQLQAEREEAREARARERSAKTANNGDAELRTLRARQDASYRAWEAQEAAREVLEEALRAAASSWVASTVDASGAASFFGPATLASDVATLEQRGVLARAVPLPALVERFGAAAWADAVKRLTRFQIGHRYYREDVLSTSRALSAVTSSQPSMRKLASAPSDDFGDVLMSLLRRALNT